MSGAPLRIAYLIQQYAPEVGAGPARAGEMVRRWTATGADVTVITAMPNRPEGRIHAAWRGRMFGEETLDGARILRSWLFARPGGGFATTVANNLTFAASASWNALRHHRRFDVLIASSPPWFPVPAGAMLSRLRKIPLVIELRDLWPDYLLEMNTLKWPALARGLVRMDRRLLLRANRVVTVTEPLREMIAAKGVEPGRIEVISNGVDPEEYFPAHEPPPSPVLERRGGECIVGYLGNFGAGQRLDVVLDAAGLLVPNPAVRFVLAGDGTDLPRIRKRVEEMRLPNLMLLPPIPRSRTRAFYNACDACLVPLAPLPVFAHALPTKFFEIMACGRPVVASAAGLVPGVLDQCGAGLSAPPGDATALAAKIAEAAAMSPAARQAMGAAGTRYVATHFHRGVLADRYLDLLRAAAAEGHR
jgi:glycosyltransferase involved in cell wall biosynthesis